jgi:putative MATE family efflux protein
MLNQSTALQRMKRTLVGDRSFYTMVFAIVLPIIVQNTISNFVNLLDNIMVGRLGADQMTGVSVVNQLMFVANLCVFGGVSGAGIFAAQYHGAGDSIGVRACFRFKIYLCFGMILLAAGVFSFFDEQLISLFLNESGAEVRVAETLRYGQQYLRIMIIGFIPFALSQAYAGTLRETGETMLPMVAGIVAVLTNLALNYVLIYGKLGFPALGVEGAAIATVISRFVELGIVAIVTHLNAAHFRFIQGAYRSLRVPMALAKQIAIKGLPLLVNEALWSIGVSTIVQRYSLRGLDVVSALNISNTMSNLFSVVFISMGNATAIIIGQALGGREFERAKDQVWKLIAFAVVCCMGMSTLLCIAAPFVPLLYNVTPSIRTFATQMLFVCAACMPLNAFANCCYFTMRSGGKTMLTFVFDCAFTWLLSLPLATVLVMYTDMGIIAVYFCVQFAEIFKCIFGGILLKKGIWIQNMVGG